MGKGLLSFTQNGIYCEKAGVYIDPWKPVDKAIITHGHADHSRWGNQEYISHHHSVPIIKNRLGEINIRGFEYDEIFTVNGVMFSLHPAGHIPGSAQVRVEHKGEAWVVSGDYKLTDDGLSVPFEPVKCHTFITECTFGLPVFRWKDQKEVLEEINGWWKANKEKGITSLLVAYSLGKAQRVLAGIDHTIGKVFTHGAIENMNGVIRDIFPNLPSSERVTRETKKDEFRGELVIAPPSALGSPWIKKFNPYSVGIASGWMSLRGTRRRRAADRGFVLSDHADWEGLNKAIEQTGAEKVITTHGYTDIFTEWLKEKGYDAVTESTEFEGESVDSDSVEGAE